MALSARGGSCVSVRSGRLAVPDRRRVSGLCCRRRARTWADDGHGALPWAGIPLGVHPRYGTARGHFCGLVRFWRHYRQPDQHPRHTRSSGDLSGWQRPDKAGQRPGGRRLFHCSVCCGNACGHDPYLPDPALRDWHRPEVWRLGDLSVLRFRSAHLRLYFWRQPAAGVDCRLGGVPAVSDRSGCLALERFSTRCALPNRSGPWKRPAFHSSTGRS